MVQQPDDAQRHDRGQATVEFALALPFVVILLLGVVQVVVVVRDQLAVGLAAREGARAASVAADPAAAAHLAATRAVSLSPLDVATVSAGGRVTVTVSYVNDTSVALIGQLVGNVDLNASVTMSYEPP
ncbi:MAG TPA: TadE/TadG family type IV pilus assembly protein [Ilumatobacter sp.]|nr:TadE/TadG family type IV pilus assembly protein [Ilumatobacter sp.]